MATLGSAQAQPADANEASPVAPASISAPEPVAIELGYPKGAKGDAEVMLELVVEADGSVSTSRVVRGSEPFGEAARTASLGWRFEPARRGEHVRELALTQVDRPFVGRERLVRAVSVPMSEPRDAHVRAIQTDSRRGRHRPDRVKRHFIPSV